MGKFKFSSLFCLLINSFFLLAKSDASILVKSDLEKSLRSQRVMFIENSGQMKDMANKPVPFVLFKMSLPGMDVYITKKGLTYVSYQITEKLNPTNTDPAQMLAIPKSSGKWECLDMQLSNANIRKENVVKEESAETEYNYYLSHCPNGIKHMKKYGRLTVKNIYPGIDWVLYNTDKGGFEYDFVVHPGADAKQIKMLYSSGRPINFDPAGNIVLMDQINLGSLTEKAPVSYIKENKQKIKSRFKIISKEKKHDHFECLVAVDVENKQLNAFQTLVIDPQLVWCTTIGGDSYESIRSIATDINGNVFITGYSSSLNFPIQNAGSYFQGLASGNGFYGLMTISKFNPFGALVWSTFYGGSIGEQGMSVAVDSQQNIFVTGIAQSSDLPLQNNGTFFQGTYGGGADALILKFDNNGNRLWATYYGGSNLEFGFSVCTDPNGNVFITGLSNSTDFPLQNAGTFFQGNLTSSGNSQGFILKFNNNGARLWATGYICDRLNAIASDNAGNVYVAGWTANTTHSLNPGGGAYFQTSGGHEDAVSAKFSNSGVLLWASYYGGSEGDYGKSIIVDKNGNMFMSGITRSKNLPVVGEGNVLSDSISSNASNEFDPFIVKFGPSSNLLWATYCGGQGHEEMSSFDNLALDGCDRVYMSFESSAPGITTFSACEGGFLDSTCSAYDQFIIRFSNSGVRLWASHLGGVGSDICSPVAVDENGVLYLGGRWEINTGSPSTYTFVNPGNGAFYSNTFGGYGDAFISRFNGGTVAQPAEFSFANICLGSTLAVLPEISANFVPGGAFSGPAVLNINSQTGELFPANTPAGTYTISYHRESCQCHASKTTVTILDCAVGMDEFAENNNLLIYTNPNNGEFSVKGAKFTRLSLYDELGQQIRKATLFPANDYRVVFSGLTPGLYFLRAEHTQLAHKIIVIND